MKTLQERFDEKHTHGAGCWLWTASRGTNGYGEIWLKGKLAKAHRVAWELHNGPIPAGLHVLHRCDVPLCVRPDHLFLGTQRDNNADMTAKRRGVSPPGERNGRHRLTRSQVEQARFLAASGITSAAIAREYGVNHSTVRRIVRGQSWEKICPRPEGWE